MMRTLLLKIDSPADRERTAEMLAALMRAGIEFEAEPFDAGRLIIRLTEVER